MMIRREEQIKKFRDVAALIEQGIIDSDLPDPFYAELEELEMWCLLWSRPEAAEIAEFLRRV